MKNPSFVQWISWLGAILLALLSMSAFVFGNFENKEDAKDKWEMVEKRLDRIENKLDQFITEKRR